MSSTKNIVIWVLSVLLALFFLKSAYPKLLQDPGTVEFFEMLGHSKGFLLLIGGLEAVGAILLLFPKFALYGAGVLVAVMIGATYTHLSTGIGSPYMALGALVVAAIVGWLRKNDAAGLGR